ncbi:MAG: esterase/lipase family protein [Rhodospirillales bacterium]
MAYPIVLAHGIARFDIMRREMEARRLLTGITGSDALHYFRNIRPFLQQRKFTVYHTNVSFAASIEQRSRDLAEQVDALCARHGKVHIIGHSMGGLDVRHMIVDIPGMDTKVASLTTVGTPHLGTSFADWGISHGGDELIRALEDVVDLRGFSCLTTAACEAFNRRAEAAEAANPVVYQAYASSQEKYRVLGPLQPSWQIIQDREGDNDGLVPVRSQLWCAELASGGHKKAVAQHRFPVSADHFNQIGWWDVREWLAGQDPDEYEAAIQAVYLQIAQSVSGIA